MVFNPETGLRDFEAELPNKDYSDDLAGTVQKAIDNADISQPPVRTDAPEVEVKAPEVKVAKANQSHS